MNSLMRPMSGDKPRSEKHVFGQMAEGSPHPCIPKHASIMNRLSEGLHVFRL